MLKGKPGFVERYRPFLKNHSGLRMLEEFVSAMIGAGIAPGDILQGGELLTLPGDNEPGRPFIVSSGKQAGRKVVCKFPTTPDVYSAARNEILFLQKATELLELTNAEIKLPVITWSRLDPPGLAEEFFEGKPMGSINMLQKGVSYQELDAIVEIIASCQDVDLSQLMKNCSGLEIDDFDHRFMYRSYRFELDYREDLVRPSLGDEYFNRMKMLLGESERFLSGGQPLLAAGDINPSNILRLEDGLAFIDWERLRVTDSPALDFGFMFAVLVTMPDKQRYFFDKAVRSTKNEKFPELMRLEYIFNRGTGEIASLISRNRKYGENNNDRVRLLVGSVKQAIDQTGPWEHSRH